MTPREFLWTTGAALPEASARPLTAAPAHAWRVPLAAKLAFAFVGLVALVLLVNGAVEAWLRYNQAKHAALEVQADKARSAAERVGEFLTEIQTELGWATGAEWKRLSLDQQRYDFIRLLRQAPAITALSYIDGQGKEQLAVSRLEPNSIASGKDFSGDPRFVRAVADKVWFGPVEFRRGSEPYMTIAVAHVGKNSGVTVADVNLKLIWDVISAIRVGEKGYAYVVDGRGRLIADPDLSLVLRDTDLSALPQVKKALAELRSAETATSGPAAPLVRSTEIAKGLDGGDVLTAYAIAPKPRWIVFVQQPLAEALGSVTQSLLRTLALLGLGLLLAVVTGIVLARRMAAPIRLLQAGAERLGAGDYSQRLDVRTGDEIEILAERFNQMAERIKESYDTLEAKVEARTRDLNEALAQQTATANVLKVISRSTFNLDAVLKTLADSARSLGGAATAVVFLREGDVVRLHAESGVAPVFLEYLNAHPIRAGMETATGRVLMTGEAMHVPDVLADSEYDYGAGPQLGDYRAIFGAPLVREGKVDGVFTLMRPEPGAFTPRQIELVRTFADQAVIAIENARLFNEVQAKTRDLEEALQQQTATADVLRVISRSTFDLGAVLKTLTHSARSLCGAATAAVFLRDGEVMRLRAEAGCAPEFLKYMNEHPTSAGRETLDGRVMMTGEAVHIPDVLADPDYDYGEGPRLGTYRAGIGVPLLRSGRVDGVFSLMRPEPGAFTPRQIELVRAFADQAVIAIENTRLFDEVQAKTRDLEESLQQQTATADVLKVISRSAFDLQTVLHTLVESAAKLCEADKATITREIDGVFYRAESFGFSEEFMAQVRHMPVVPERGSISGRAMLEGKAIQVEDVEADPEYWPKAFAKPNELRSGLGIPMMRNGAPIGVLALMRTEVRPFNDKQIELVQTFADQAVIAIENARLFDEVQAKTRDLEEALAQQTATAEVLKVISRSAFDLQAVLTTLAQSAQELCGASFATVHIRDGAVMQFQAHSGCTPEAIDFLRAHPILSAGRETNTGLVMLTGRIAHRPDVLADPEYDFGSGPEVLNYRAVLGVPLLRDGRVEGVFNLARAEPGPFTPRQIEMVQAFADQAVIAIENARLFEEVQARTRELAASLDDLRKAQDRLIQSEKLASLGQLTAGIAHEIKNPLNFVNNFAGLSRELVEELRDLLAKLPLEAQMREEADGLIALIRSNLDKVAQHGGRADSIVKNMLLHTREGSGERASVNVNAMVEEALNLAYHGARAEKPAFNVTIRRSLDPNAGQAELFHQEITRVLLNLISNSFYATTKRKQIETDPDYEPTLAASTRDLGESVEIVIRDNGTGIPDEVRAKMFNPFFTTKPAGEGTGLGLSLSHDIVCKQHAGAIEVDSELGSYAMFTIRLPRAGGGPAQNPGAPN